MMHNEAAFVANGAPQTPAFASSASKGSGRKKRMGSREWGCLLSDDRPVYRCPDCRDAAMQFYAVHPSIPHRTDCFCCHACGTCWEV